MRGAPPPRNDICITFNVAEVQGEQTAALLHMATSGVRHTNNAT